MQTGASLTIGSTLVVTLALGALVTPASAQKAAPSMTAKPALTAKAEKPLPAQAHTGQVNFSDCTFTPITCPSCTNQFKVTTNLQNKTNGPVSFAAGQAMATHTRTDWKTPFRASKTMAAPGGGMYLAPGASTTLSENVGPLAPGEYQFNWTADPDNHIDAPKVTKPTKTCSLTVTGAPMTGALADLAFTSIWVTPTAGTPSDPYVFKLGVKNRGHATISGNPRMDCRIDGAIFATPAGMSAYAPNTEFSLTMNRAAGLTPGTHKVECFLDYDKKMVEEFEDNNTIAQTFVVKGP